MTNKAIKDLSKIWDYTFKVWSERRADKYYESLISNCQEIANNLLFRKKYGRITQNPLGMKMNRHIIFYKTLNKNYIEITRILHERRMDLKKRMTE
ncbi:type II toxin-antitoxin system RelE/ParE family toxin [Lutibacter sp.]|uniref:type II toxin-antitoxin system RelE/ParE family toxin n=1 Tax=Lutibacter sp. TaxID=1925666 RepID=UPI0034553942